MLKKVFLLIGILLFVVSLVFIEFKYFTSTDKKVRFLKQNQNFGQAVLAAATQAPHFIFKVNIPSFFNDTAQFAKDVDIEGGLTVKGKAVFSSGISLNNNNLDLGKGDLTAGNVLYSIIAGKGLSVTSGQNPTVTNTGVLSLQGQKGALSLIAGNNVNINGLTVSAIVPSAPNSFATINTGDTSFSAGDTADTLTLTAGNGISLTSDTGNKKITISQGSGNSGAFSSLIDTGLITNGIIYANSSSTLTSISPTGTSGMLLQSNGTGAAPSWVFASGVGTNYWSFASNTLSPSVTANTLKIGQAGIAANLVVGADGGIPGAATIRGAAATGNSVTGANITFDASNGTGLGGSGDLIFRTAPVVDSSLTRDAVVSKDDGGAQVSSLTWTHIVRFWKQYHTFS
jgi:hypothetical protein